GLRGDAQADARVALHQLHRLRLPELPAHGGRHRARAEPPGQLHLLHPRRDEVGEGADRAGARQPAAVERAHREQRRGDDPGARVARRLEPGSRADVEQVETNLGEVRAAALRLRDAVAAINQWLGKFDGAIEDILGVAGVTHVVSVNASLEAARAGESGKPFVPIVGAVRRLAEDSRAVAQAISLERKSVGARIDEIDGVSALLESSTALVEAAMQDLTAAATRIAAQSGEISETARLLAESVSEEESDGLG
ncbi:MAG TPA: hypothetical protein DFS52_05965, partial [Myxococcales bacterium]|nr:hypothetical protein [Myxococcales bacterium]